MHLCCSFTLENAKDQDDLKKRPEHYLYHDNVQNFFHIKVSKTFQLSANPCDEITIIIHKMIALKLIRLEVLNEIGLILSNENYLETIQSKYDL